MADDLICVDDNAEYLVFSKGKNTSTDSSSSSSDDEAIVPVKKKRGATRRGLAKRLAQQNADFEQKTDNNEDNIYTSSLFNPDSWEVDYKKAELKLAADSDVEDDIPSIFTKKKSPPIQKTTKKKGKARGKVDDNQNSEPFLIESEEVEIEEGTQNTSIRRSPTPPPSQSDMNQKTKLKKLKGIKKTMKGLTQASERFKAAEEDGADVSIVDVTLSPEVTTKDIVVKIRSRSGIQRFPMKINDTFHQVFKDMCSHECVKLEQIVMFIDDRTVRPYDSPRALNITVADIIDCHIRKKEECKAQDWYSDDVLYPEDDPDVIAINVQGKAPKSRTVIRMRMHETMERLMQKFSTQVKVPLAKLTFHFDGDEVGVNDLASELDLEDGYTIDVSGV